MAALEAAKQGAAAKAMAPITVHINDHDGNAPAKFPSNYIRTTKYTLLSFVPMNLFYQFHKVSNCFFLANMIIALIPGVSPVFPATTILPLVAVLAAAAARDAYEDYQRYASDKRANSTPVEIVATNGNVESVPSEQVRAGDVLYLQRGAQIMADAVILSSSLEDGACFVETANLDGETNLKPKQAKMMLQSRYPTPAAVATLAGNVECDAPNNSLHKWQGKVAAPEVGELAVDMDNLLLRGCAVRNVDWVMAAVVYTGVHSKLFLNLTEAPPKTSRLDKKLNRLVLMILGVQQSLLLLMCILNVVFLETSDGAKAFHLQPILDDEPWPVWFILTYLTYFILLSTFLPISLFVSLEFCKTIQGRFMMWDDGMGHDGRNAVARTTSLNEELSQVQYVFTDKTGTLTDNQMRFAKAFTEHQEFDELTRPGSMRRALGLHVPDAAVAGGATVANFLRLLSLNNAVVINADEAGALSYDGSSTDEVALVGTAAKNGYKLLSRTSDTMTVGIDRPTAFDVPDVLPFTPERKMMSVVIKEKDGTIRMYTKGADSSVMARLSADNDPAVLKEAQSFLDRCAHEGLRTLACAERIFTQAEYDEWKQQWNAASLTVSADRADRVHEAALAAEAQMTFVGCTAIEDRLQDEVPETIHFLLRCGMVVWVLTGDKRETAVNISRTSRLLDPDTDLVVQIDLDLPASIPQQIDQCTKEAREAKARGRKSSFVIDGRSLEKVLEDARTLANFKALGLIVDSAVCCRVTPLQKASVVALFQADGATCLGVGDGANDVSMIQEARVGIGIMGLEGSQAERASDYAIPRFRHLRRLLAIHGRYSLVRNSGLIQYSFYKNLVFSMAHIYYSFYNAYSGQTIFDSWVLTFYNMAFTFLPPLAMGIFDYDVRDSFILDHPQLYGELRSPFAIRMSRVTAFLWIMLALLHSWVGFFGNISTTFDGAHRDDGRGEGMWADGTVLCNTLLLIVLVQAGLTFLSWTWIHATSIALSAISYIAFIFLYGALPPTSFLDSTYYHVPMVVFGTANNYFCAMLWFMVVFGPHLVLMAIRRRIFHTQMHAARIADYERKRQLPWVTVPGDKA